MDIEKTSDIGIQERLLIALTLTKAMAVPGTKANAESIFESYSEIDLVISLNQLATLIVHQEAIKEGITPEEYIERMRAWVLASV